MGSEEQYVLDVTFIADGDITKEHVVVYSTTDGKVSLPGEANASKVVGIAMDDADDGAPIRIRRLGVALVIAAGAISHGDYVQVAGTAGKVQSVTPAISPASSELLNVVGQAEGVATADGDEIPVFINHFIAQR